MWDQQTSGGEAGFVSPATEETALDDFDDERCCFFLTHLRIKPSSDLKKKKKRKKIHV